MKSALLDYRVIGLLHAWLIAFVFARQGFLQDMQEQMGKLTDLLKDERRSHQHSCRAVRYLDSFSNMVI
jgi:hypothetical protein